MDLSIDEGRSTGSYKRMIFLAESDVDIMKLRPAKLADVELLHHWDA